MSAKLILPKILQDPKASAKYIGEAYGSALLGSTSSSLKKAGFNVRQINSNRMEVTIRQMAKKGIYDMKPFFKESPKAKRKKDGTGWYLVVPIRLQRRKMRGVFDSSDRTYNAMKERFDEIDLEPLESKTLNISELLNGVSSGRGLQDLGKSDISSSLDYSPKSGNVTASKSKSGARTTYTAYRTVSSKSMPQSWVMGRRNNDQVNSDNISKALNDGIRTLMNKRMKQMGLK